jgi:aspartate/methionine/tyrosine aminotransferase
VGGVVALPRPSWVSYAAQASLLGQAVVWVPILPGEGGVPDPHRFEAAVVRARRAGTRVGAVVLALPDSPTGTLASAATVRAVCEIARSHDLWVISDEIYRDLVHDTERPFLSPAAVIPDQTAVTTGLSKSLALGGWRIGMARFPGTKRGARLHAEVAMLASEIWSAPPRTCRARGGRGVPPGGRRDSRPRSRVLPLSRLRGHREFLRRAHGIDSGSRLAGALLEGPGIATFLPRRSGNRTVRCGCGWRPAGCTAPRRGIRRRP